ncbi:hypothetical protein [Candidatus Viridilinea mediisalina]|uniref:Phytase-like domain-containing protein n=1 Tax=Candidatus Viridilinea mediisalina TaxID=2024553 RepID=A0A2A6RPG1_9CHLR|nr:hypothetical protein [Candidatus Viridilinea mediisalina]PDW04791.1 hypothetical protein CJ255_01740 [Candidatus Viridilinea mediisalina]
MPQRPRSTPFRRPTSGLSVSLVVVGLVLLALALVVARSTRPATPTGADGERSGLPIPTDDCRSLPGFMANPEIGLSGGGLALATNRSEMGLVLLSTRQPDQTYQHPTWRRAGYLGPIAYDREGNIYVAPTPRLSLADNPLAGATTIWRVAAQSGEMAPFVRLPGAAHERNPYGIIGLSYVCDLHWLYAGHVIGGTPTSEHGGVVAIDLNDGTMRPIVDNTDVMGILVVERGEGYELYLALARSPEVMALPLDANGMPAGDMRPLLDLEQAGASASERVRKLRLVDDELIADLVPFNYSLQTSAANEPNRVAAWRYNATTGQWEVSRRAALP